MQILQIEVPESPNYYGILPASVRYNKNISSSAKVIYTELTALSNKDGYCWASNNYFAKLYGVDDKTISKWINELYKEKLIHIQMEKNYLRKIFPSPLHEKPTPLVEKGNGGLPEKADNNITSINTKINNKYNTNSFTNLSTIQKKCPKCGGYGLITMMKNNHEYSIGCSCKKGYEVARFQGFQTYEVAIKNGYIER